MEVKICRICGQEKEINLFEIDSRMKSKHTNRCKACKYASQSVANKAWHHLKERAAKEGRKLEVSQGDIEKLFSTFESCIYCGVNQKDVDEVFHIDHITARSLGGNDVLENLCVCCAECNRKKGAKTVAEFFFENRERISDSNFTLLTHYIAIVSGQPVEEIIFDIANQYAEKEIARVKAT